MNERVRSEQTDPFFARFLEGQFPKVRTDVKAGKPPGGGGGGGNVTQKYPSDDDEGETS
jgi:hypothetical protein